MIYELHEKRREKKAASTCLLHMPGMIAGSFLWCVRSTCMQMRLDSRWETREHLPPFMQTSVLGNGLWEGGRLLSGMWWDVLLS